MDRVRPRRIEGRLMRDDRRPRWAADHHGWIIGERWRLAPPMGDVDDRRWGVVWNPTTGEAVAIQICDQEAGGPSILLASVPRPTRWGPAIPRLIRDAQGESLFSLALRIQVVAMGATWDRLLAEW